LLEKLILRYIFHLFIVTPWDSYCITPSSQVEAKDIVQIKKTKQVPIRLRVLNVIKFWVENHFEDFNPDLIGILTDFLDHTASATGIEMKLYFIYS
jgi:hypothetical protein